MPYAKDPVEGIAPGTVLPLGEFPDELRCPWCQGKENGEKFKTENALRGHAHSKHGIRWELPEKPEHARDGPAYALMTQPKDREDLKPWHMIGLAMHELYGLTWEEIGDRLGRGHTVLSTISHSPAGTRFRGRLKEMCETPEAVALLLMKANAINVTADFFAALEWAKEARDYVAVHRMTKDLLVLAGAEESQKEEKGAQKQELHIHLDARDLAAPYVTSSMVMLDAEIVDDNHR